MLCNNYCLVASLPIGLYCIYWFMYCDNFVLMIIITNLMWICSYKFYCRNLCTQLFTLNFYNNAFMYYNTMSFLLRWLFLFISYRCKETIILIVIIWRCKQAVPLKSFIHTAAHAGCCPWNLSVHWIKVYLLQFIYWSKICIAIHRLDNKIIIFCTLVINKPKYIKSKKK